MKVGELVKVGDLVRSTLDGMQNGIIVGWVGTEPVVYWSEKFPNEIEYKDQLEVIDGSR